MSPGKNPNYLDDSTESRYDDFLLDDDMASPEEPSNVDALAAAGSYMGPDRAEPATAPGDVNPDDLYADAQHRGGDIYSPAIHGAHRRFSGRELDNDLDAGSHRVGDAGDETFGHRTADAVDGFGAAEVNGDTPVPSDAVGNPSASAPSVDEQFAQAVQLMQNGAWPEVVTLLRKLRKDHGGSPEIDALLEEATLRAHVVEPWGDTIEGRRLSVVHERLLRRLLPYALLFAFAVCGLAFYQLFIAPSRHVVAMSEANHNLIQRAQEAFQAGQYRESLELYDRALTSDPESLAVRQARAAAKDKLTLAVQYDMAMEMEKAGNPARALELLNGIQAADPTFRNVETAVDRLESALEARTLFADAENAYEEQDWLDAVQDYEALRTVDKDFEADTVKPHLNEAYLGAAQTILASWPDEVNDPDVARQYLLKAASFDRDKADAEMDQLKIFQRGEDAVQDQDWRQAINLWRGLYEERPDYLGGYLAEELYRIYLTLGMQTTEEEDFEYTIDLYERALELDVENTQEAESRLADLKVLAAATPTPTPAPRWSGGGGYVEPQPRAYAPPTPTPMYSLNGWIAFRTSRNGREEIYVMQTDGSNQHPAPVDWANRFDEMYDQERKSPDGAREAYVVVPSGRTHADIYIRNTANPLNPDDQSQDFLLTNYTLDEYDPVWSPDGTRIAFVSNNSYNDEILTITPDTVEQRQLTHNEWEWDKHPTWSPDSLRLAFFSNRTGNRQIWIMNADGTNQVNLSRNDYEDWDPVWIKE